MNQRTSELQGTLEIHDLCFFLKEKADSQTVGGGEENGQALIFISIKIL